MVQRAKPRTGQIEGNSVWGIFLNIDLCVREQISMAFFGGLVGFIFFIILPPLTTLNTEDHSLNILIRC